MRRRRHRGRHAATILVATVALGTLGAGQVLAGPSSGPGLAVSGGLAGPVHVVPGGSATEVFTVADNGRTTLSVSIEVTGLSTNGTAPQFTGTPSPGLAVTVQPRSFMLTPRAARSVTVTLAAAPHTPPGGLFAGLLIRGQAPTAANQVAVVGEVGEPLFVRVPGAVVDTGIVEGFAFAGPLTPQGPAGVVLRFHNTGTVDYPLTGTVTFYPATGSPATVPLPRDVVLPTDHRSIAVRWVGPAPPGQLRAVLLVRWGLTGEHETTATAVMQVPALTAGTGALTARHPGRRARDTPVSWLVRILASALIGLLLLALLLLWAATRRRRRRADQQPAPGSGGPADVGQLPHHRVQ